MPILEVKILEGRTKKQKQAMVEKITDVLINTIDAKREAVKIHIIDMKRDHYAIGGQFIENMK